MARLACVTAQLAVTHTPGLAAHRGIESDRKRIGRNGSGIELGVEHRRLNPLAS